MTLLRIIIWFVALLGAMLGAVWLANRPGSVVIEWQSWRVDTSVGVLLLALLVVIALATTLWLLWRWIAGAPGALFESWGAGRRRRGYQALTQGMVAVAAGDPVDAKRMAQRAEKLLPDDARPLTLLLSAQAAQVAGDRDAARRSFEAMLDDEQTAFLGLRGLIVQAIRDGEAPRALTYAEQAFKLRPDTPWVTHSLFDMQAHAGKWRDALETLDSGLRRKLVDPDRGRVLKALLLVERSRAAERAGNDTDAAGLAREALALAPERIPVVQRHAELLLKAGDGRRAMRVIERGWASAPHSDLATLYLAAANEKDAVKRVQLLGRLTSAAPDDVESHVVLARECLEARLWGEARRHLSIAVTGATPSNRICRLMADLEEQEFGDGAKVRQWLARAADAPQDRAWRCSACGFTHERWQSICDSCGAFGTLNWRAPASIGQLLPAASAVDAPEAPPAPVPPALPPTLPAVIEAAPVARPRVD
jgi:HemY protein